MYYEGITEVYDAAYEAGINVVVAGGNDAHSGDGSLWGGDRVKSDTVSTGTLGMPGTFNSVLTVASAENSHVINTLGNTLSWFNKKQNITQNLTYTEVGGVPAGKGFRERLVGQYLQYTTSLDDSQGKLLFLDGQDGNVDHLIEQAAEAGAVGLVVNLPQRKRTASTGDATTSSELTPLKDKSRIVATRFDIPTCGSEKVQFDWMVAQRPEDNMLFVSDHWNPKNTAGQLSDFSSWGPTDGLTLKPEITGIGGEVFSAYGTNTFAVLSGTSMASPSVVASVALLRQYLRENELVREDDLAYVANSLITSTAIPIVDEEHGTYYFVRRQGAGLANVGKAIASNAYIAVDGVNKAKLELGDDPEKTGIYEMTFKVMNISDEAKTYTLDVTALGQKAEGGQIRGNQVTYLTDDYARELEVTVTSSLKNGEIRVPAGGMAEVTVTVALSEAEKAYYDERFPAGAYVEGFIQLLGENTPNLVVPYLGFYGDYGAAPILEPGGYETTLSGVKSYTTADQFHNTLWGTVPMLDIPHTEFKEAIFYLGDTTSPSYDKISPKDFDYATMFSWASEFYPEQAGISPNGDNFLDFLNMGISLRRNAENIHYTVKNRDTGEIIYEQDTGFLSKTYVPENYAGRDLILEWLYPTVISGSTIYYDTSKCLLKEDTWVEITAEVTPEYAGGQTQTISFPVYIDNTPPAEKEHVRLYFDQNTKNYMVSLNLAENWFLDYSMQITLNYNTITGIWEGFIGTATAAGTDTPIRGSAGSINVGAGRNFTEMNKRIILSYDYAGNSTVYEIVGGDKVLEYINLTAEKTDILVGESLTIKDIGNAPYSTALNWGVSDPAVAQIVTSDDHSVTIKGLAEGTVTVSGGVGTLVKTMEVEVHSCYHENTELRNAEDATCTKEGYTGDTYCTDCGKCLITGETTAMADHTYEAVVTDPDCTEEGYTTYTCTVCGDSYVDDATHANGHSYTTQVVEPTCTDVGYTLHTCSVCGDSYMTDIVEPVEHDYILVEIEPTCTEAGYTMNLCNDCGDSEITEVFNATGHAHEAVVTEPTCTEAGYTTYTCHCGDTYTDDWTEALGHSYGQWTVTRPETCTENGEESRTCDTCGETQLREIEASCPAESFTDLDSRKWYHEGVCFVLRNNLMKGVGENVFAPDGTLSRAQLVTVLYRMEGEPAVAGMANPFSDVAEGQWYTEAVIWAANNGIVNGISETVFAPNANITREQIVTILYRYSGAEQVETDALSQYADASAVSQWAYDAMNWAVANGLVNGVTETVLQPGGTATRAQLATILVRFCDYLGN